MTTSHAKLFEAATAALPLLDRDRNALVEGACLTGPDGEPDLETIDDITKPFVDELDRVIADLRAALEAAGWQPGLQVPEPKAAAR